MRGRCCFIDLCQSPDIFSAMPRQPRLDIPGLLQHAIVRGIERSAIFLDDEDRSRFVDRLGSLLVETETECYAWVIIAQNRYKALVTDGIAMGRRPELVGGGLRRCFELSGQAFEMGAHDDRGLGSGDFVESLGREDRVCRQVPARIRTIFRQSRGQTR